MKRLFLPFLLVAGIFAWHWASRSPARQEVTSFSEKMNLISPTHQAQSPSISYAVEPSSSRKRIPASAVAGVEELEGESPIRWAFKKNSEGFVTKMSDGRFFLGGESPADSARSFLDRFARGVFGFDPATGGTPEVRAESETAQVIMAQIIHGLPVQGARINLIFDTYGNLIHGVSDVYRGPTPPLPAPAVSSAVAAMAVRSALAQYLALDDAQMQKYPTDFFRRRGRLAYRLKDGHLSLIYRYEFTLLAPDFADMEAMIDSELGTIVLLKNLNTK